MFKKFTLSLILILLSASSLLAMDHTLALKPGFNFVSFKTAVSLSPSQFKALDSSIEDIYLFSAAAGSFLSANEGTLSSLAAGKGYIVKKLGFFKYKRNSIRRRTFEHRQHCAESRIQPCGFFKSTRGIGFIHSAHE